MIVDFASCHQVMICSSNCTIKRLALKLAAFHRLLAAFRQRGLSEGRGREKGRKKGGKVLPPTAQDLIQAVRVP